MLLGPDVETCQRRLLRRSFQVDCKVVRRKDCSHFRGGTKIPGFIFGKRPCGAGRLFFFLIATTATTRYEMLRALRSLIKLQVPSTHIRDLTLSLPNQEGFDMLETMDGSFFLDTADEITTPLKESRTISRPQPDAKRTSSPAVTTSNIRQSPPQQQPVSSASLRSGTFRYSFHE